MQMSDAQRAMKNLKSNAYGVEIEVGINNGDRASASVVINRRDFAITELYHTVIGDDGNDSEQYSINFSLQNEERFFKDIVPMARIFGSTHHGIWRKFIPAIQVPEQMTIVFEVINRYPAPLQDPFTVQIWISGDEIKKDGEGR